MRAAKSVFPLRKAFADSKKTFPEREVAFSGK
jgi:hypothetical protein